MAAKFFEELVTSGVQGVITEFVKGVTADGTEVFALLGKLEEFYETLKHDVQRIQAVLEDHENTIQRPKNKTTTRRFDVWRSDVKKMIEKAKKLEDEYQNVSGQSKIWLLSRLNFVEDVKKMIDKVEELKGEENCLGEFLVDKPFECVLKVNAPDITRFDTLYGPLQKVLGYLNNKKVKRVAIVGSLGVGKTTILQNLNNHRDVSKTFEVVIFISQVRNEEELQNKIAARLMLQKEDVSAVLKDKKCLLLLDEVECPLDLQSIGIPENKEGSKVVIATKSDFIANRMDVDRLPINVKTLSKDEAWNMFQVIVGEVIDSSDIEPIARQVAEECGGIPLLIKNVASNFKLMSTDSEWRVELEELRRLPEERVPGFNEIHAFVKLCYDNLSDQHKCCFLYGALYPTNASISTDILVECWASEGLLGEIDENKGFRGLRDVGNVTLINLIRRTLFESDEKDMYVSMNGIVRQVAHYISSNIHDYRFLPEASRDLFDGQNINIGEKSERISIIGSELSVLPESPNCTIFRSLLLQENLDLEEIPPSFFETMKNLFFWF